MTGVQTVALPVLQVERDLAVREQLADTADLNVDDRPHMILPEPVKQDDLVEPIEEFRAEMAAHHLHHLRLDIRDRLVVAHCRQILATEIRDRKSTRLNSSH